MVDLSSSLCKRLPEGSPSAVILGEHQVELGRWTIFEQFYQLNPMIIPVYLQFKSQRNWDQNWILMAFQLSLYWDYWHIGIMMGLSFLALYDPFFIPWYIGRVSGQSWGNPQQLVYFHGKINRKKWMELGVSPMTQETSKCIVCIVEIIGDT